MKNIDLHEEHNNFLEHDNEQAPESVQSSYKGMHDSFDDYLSAVVECMWMKGFKYAMKLME